MQPSAREPGEEPALTRAETYRQPDRLEKGLVMFDRLIRNIAVAACLLLLVVAVRSVREEPLQSVFSSLQKSVSLEWDESLGRLSFVNNLLPQDVRTVWSQQTDATLLTPLQGQVVHAWSQQEPYLGITGAVSEVRAAMDGEVMSVAHGPDEELILRVRHENGLETLYGNLSHCFVEEGDAVYAGDVIASLPQDTSLAFDLRREGRSVDPTKLLHEARE